MKRNKGLISIFLGLLLIAAAFFLTAYNVYDGLRAEKSANQALDRLGDMKTKSSSENDVSEIPDYMLNPDMEMPVKTIDGVDYIGVLSIPVLKLELPVISSWSYSGLKTALCRYSGSAYLNNMVIAGHNYAAYFGNLRNLVPGDQVIFTDMDGNSFDYKVVEQEILQPEETEKVENGDWDLTLFTCTPGGQSRVTIRCDLEKNSLEENHLEENSLEDNYLQES